MEDLVVRAFHSTVRVFVRWRGPVQQSVSTFISFSDRANTKLYNLLVSRPEWSIKINRQFQGNIEVFKWS